MSKNIYQSLIIGSIWGMVEATLGYFLHMISIPIGWLLWFPVAFFFIHKSYDLTKSYSSVILTAVIAASFKFINLLFPGQIHLVFNPAASILLEAIAVVLVMHQIKEEKFNIFNLFLVGTTYRVLFICYLSLLPEGFLTITAASDFTTFIKFMFLENTINTILIYSYLNVFERFKVFHFEQIQKIIKEISYKRKLFVPTLSIFILLLAIFVTIVIR